MTPLDLAQVEAVFRLVRREVWLVTATAHDRRGGLAATWVSQASLDREHPVVLIGIAPNHFTAELIDQSNAFALHLLHANQTELALRFALSSGRDSDKLAHLPVTSATTGSPIISSSLAWLDCRVFARLASGDRTYYWADVLASSQRGWDAASPLTDQQLLAAATPEQRMDLVAQRDADCSQQRPGHEAWRANLPGLLQPKLK